MSTQISWLSRPVSTVFLDRDGVINEKMPEGRYVTSVREFRILPGVPEAIARLNRAGIRVIIVSNQRGIALGIMSTAMVEEIHRHLQQLLNASGARIDAFYVCPHDRNSCSCRKPLPGLYKKALEDFPDITNDKSVMIGDSISDMEFGRRLGMRTVRIQKKVQIRVSVGDTAQGSADADFSDLSQAVDYLLERIEAQPGI